MSEAIVVVNAGSTSLKFAAYAVDPSRSLPLLCRGQIDSMESNPHFVVNNAAGKQLGAHEWGEEPRDRPQNSAAFRHHLAGSKSR